MMNFDPAEHAIEEGYIGVKEKMDIFRKLKEKQIEEN